MLVSTEFAFFTVQNHRYLFLYLNSKHVYDFVQIGLLKKRSDSVVYFSWSFESHLLEY